VAHGENVHRTIKLKIEAYDRQKPKSLLRAFTAQVETPEGEEPERFAKDLGDRFNHHGIIAVTAVPLPMAIEEAVSRVFKEHLQGLQNNVGSFKVREMRIE
jgi:hypothetical protein